MNNQVRPLYLYILWLLLGNTEFCLDCPGADVWLVFFSFFHIYFYKVQFFMSKHLFVVLASRDDDANI